MMQFIIIMCSLLGLVSSFPLYNSTSAPAKVVKTGIGEISQVFKTRDTEYYTNFVFGTAQQPSEINKLTQENDQFSDTRIPIKNDRGPNDSENVPGSLTVELEANQKNGSEQDSDIYTLSWTETGPDYTAETTEYETTTDSLVNRVGGAGGASAEIVASLLG